MPDRATIPPPDKLIRELEFADFTHGYFTELVERTSPRFQALSPIRRGTPYAACVGADQRVIDEFSNSLVFLKETVPVGSNAVAGMPQDQLVRWHWASSPDAEASYSAEVAYLYESVSHPAYSIPFRIRRDVYDANPSVAIGTAFTGLVAIKVTAAGTGYTKEDTVNISGSHGAEAKLVVDAVGAIMEVIVTKNGSAYDSASLPTVTITTSTGSGATLVAIVLPKTALLVSQKKVEMEDGDPMSHEFVRVLRVYAVLPGPVLNDQEYDQQWDVVIPSTRQIVKNVDITLGTNRQQIKAIDSVKSELITFDPSVLNAVFGTYLLSYPNTANLQLPDVITSITVLRNEADGEGEYSETADGIGTPPTFYMSMHAQGTAQGSASAQIDLAIEYKQYWARNVPTTTYFFFIPANSTADYVLGKLVTLIATVSGTFTVTIASPGVVTWTSHGLNNGDMVVFKTTGALPTGLSAFQPYYVINKTTHTFQVSLTSGGTAINTSGTQSGVHTAYKSTLTSWPKFIPQGHTIICKGQKVSAEARAKAGFNQSATSGGGSSTAVTSGSGTSRDVSTSMRAINIPPALHGLIDLAGGVGGAYAISPSGITATADATGAATATADAGDIIAHASVHPTSLAATTPTSISGTGSFIYHFEVSPYRFGWARVVAEVVDATTFA